jgi:hypothetical protein
MFSLALRNINLITSELNQSHLIQRRLFISGFVLLCCSLVLVGFLVGLSSYSPDSWAYYELSKTIFHYDFYKFNTYRSYFSSDYSASFPFGYPVLLAIAQSIMGKSPFIAVVMNLATAVTTWIVIIELAKKKNLAPLTGLTLATSLVLFDPYLDEVFSGRSVPIAMLFFLLALREYFSRRLFICGFFFGFSALVRFDYLAYAIVLQAAAGILNYKQEKMRLLLMVSGFLLGVLPWVLYSAIHFGKIWVSENTWVALSASPAFVLDFPAVATTSVYDNPLMWVRKVMSNIVPLTHSIISASSKFPVFFLSFLAFLCCLRELPNITTRKSIILLSCCAISVAPYLLTGYFDERYFSLLLLCSAGSIIFLVESSKVNETNAGIYNATIVIALVLSVFYGSNYMTKQIRAGILRLNKPNQTEQIIEQLRKCHEMNPKVVYIFMGELGYLAPQYGALTGNRAAFIPSNYDKMSELEKERYFSHMMPYTLINDREDAKKCPRYQ